MDKTDLKLRRFLETRKVAEYLDVVYEVLDIDDGCLEPTIQHRETLIRLLRKYQPDIVITHPLNDYHPDHRYTAQLVLDTAYMLNVPLYLPDVPAIQKRVAYFHFNTRPLTDKFFTAVLIPVDNYMKRKLFAMHLNTSQMYEWLPWAEYYGKMQVPHDEQERLIFSESNVASIFSKKLKNNIINTLRIQFT